MFSKSVKFARVLFPILTVAVLAAGCKDSTGPDHGDPKEHPQAGTISAPSAPGDPPPAVPSDAPQPASERSVAAGENFAASVATSMVGDLTPCRWSGTWCFRWVSLNHPAYLELAINFTADFVYIWERPLNTSYSWQQHYAVRRYDLAVWTLFGTQWHPYLPNSIQLPGDYFIIGAPDGCGVGLLCYFEMLNPQKWLMNGTTVVDFLRRLTSGT